MTTDEQLTILRKRVTTLEQAMMGWADVMEATAHQRERAYKAVVEALVTDWTTAIIADPDMTDEQRAYWLDPARNDPTPEEGEPT